MEQLCLKYQCSEMFTTIINGANFQRFFLNCHYNFLNKTSKILLHQLKAKY